MKTSLFVTATTLFALACPAAMGQTVTLNYTGVITSASGTYSALNPSTPGSGAQVSGTYTFNLGVTLPPDGSNGVLTTTGTLGSLSANGWSVGVEGGIYFGYLPTNVQVFQSTTNIQGSGISYKTAAPNATMVQSGASGYDQGDIFGASEEVATGGYQSITSESDSVLHISTCYPASCFSANGVPQLAATSIATGEFEVCNGTCGVVDYKLTSLTPAVPEPTTWQMLLAGLLTLVPRIRLAAGRVCKAEAHGRSRREFPMPAAPQG